MSTASDVIDRLVAETIGTDLPADRPWAWGVRALAARLHDAVKTGEILLLDRRSAQGSL